MSNKATKAQATKVLKAVEKQFKGWYQEGKGPHLVENFTGIWSYSEPQWAVMWEEGPYEWVHKSRWETQGAYVEPYNSFTLTVYKDI